MEHVPLLRTRKSDNEIWANTIDLRPRRSIYVCGRDSVLVQRELTQRYSKNGYIEYDQFEYLVNASLEAAGNLQQCL